MNDLEYISVRISSPLKSTNVIVKVSKVLSKIRHALRQ